jgi:hypothetical protein
VFEKYGTLPCALNQDCGVYYEKNACTLSCGTPMPLDAHGSLTEDLNAYAKICEGCPFSRLPPCAPIPDAACIDGRCQFTFVTQ